MYFLTILFALFAVEPMPADTVMLAGVDVVSSVKISDDSSKQPYSITTIRRTDIEGRHLNSVKEMSAIVPNYYQPAYGSSMTSSIYMRGFGSRIDQPVVGMSVDNIPLMNKNNYDFELFDIDKVQVIRGAQSMLYGRNTIGGAINITTLSPLTFQGKRLMLEYGSENSVRVKAAHYAAPTAYFGWSAGVYYSHSDGLFDNMELGEKCDGGDNAAARLRFQWLPGKQWSIDNSFTVGYTDEGGWGYRRYDAATGILAPIAYNEPCRYRRFNVSNGLVVKRFFDTFTLSSTTGLQFLDDKMRLDNDFLSADYFTLEQSQREYAVTQEFVVKSGEQARLRWLAGVFGFYKHLDMNAPVHFREYGVQELIASRLPSWYMIDETAFTIADDFRIPTYGAAAYAQIGYTLGSFDFEAGVRTDYEYSRMNYASSSLIHYTIPGHKEHEPLPTIFAGKQRVDAFEVLPGVSVTYRHAHGAVFASLRKGFKSGGFNTQLFSDILQNKMVRDMQGVPFDSDASATKYNPEESWNYEFGGRLSLFDGNLELAGSLFYIACKNQQLTVLPKTGTGRMMSNAGESRSYGAEFSARYIVGDFIFDGAYGYTHATFEEYNDGDADYTGNYLPYAPQETISLNVAYNIPVSESFARRLVLNVGWEGFGRIYWNESNTLSQSFYGLLRASLAWEKGHYGVSLWGKNLLDRDYRTFYFRSISNDFFSMGKPVQCGISLYLNL